MVETSTVKKQPVRLFEAMDRYQACRVKFGAIQQRVNILKQVNDPGVRDILEQFGVIGLSVNEAGAKFDGDSKTNCERHLRQKDLKLIRNLEILLEELDGIVREAYEELVDESLAGHNEGKNTQSE